MKRPFLSAGLILASLGLVSAGCSQTGSKATTSKSKPVDPTSWADGDAPKTSSSSLPQSSGRLGGLSNESQDIERSLGIGR
jgi:hypothetical protein